jgi:hypothetical protein
VSVDEAAERSADSRGVFTPLTAALMVLVGVFAFSALVVLLAYAPEFESGDNGQAQALSRSAVGFAGMAKALKLAGEPVVVNRGRLPSGARDGLLVVTPDLRTARAAIDALAFGGPVLAVLPKWEIGPDFRRRGWVVKNGVIDPMAYPSSLVAALALHRRANVGRAALSGAGGPFPSGTPLRTGPIDRLQSIAAPGWTPVLTDERGATILARDPNRPLYVLSDPDLLNTQGIADPDTFAAGLAILRGLRAGEGAIIFDVRLNGLGKPRSLLRLLFDPPFLAVTLCLAAAAALAGFQAFCRFGPVRRSGRVIPLGKAALVDNTAALVRLAGRQYRMGSRYADLTAALAARAVGAPRGLGGEALTAFLDRLSARRGLPKSLSMLAAEARLARTADQVAAAASRLHAWRTAMMGGDRDGAAARPRLTGAAEAGWSAQDLQPKRGRP